MQSPSVVVLTIGTNYLLEGDGPRATAAGVLADVAMIHQFEPQAQVLVLGTPPGGASPNDPYRSQVNQTDALVAQMLAGDSRATFVNIAPAFESGDGSISNLIMFDSIHPTTLGYADMTAALVTRSPRRISTISPSAPYCNITVTSSNTLLSHPEPGRV